MSTEPRQIKIVVGLGNPGRRYGRTRHNLGFWCVDRLAGESSISLSKRFRLAVVGEGTIGDSPAVLAKPRSFVNDSGSAVGSLLTRYRASVADLVVVHDDLDLPSGKLRVRSGGGAGGHRGVKSVIDAVGTQAFARVRVGIGRPPEGVDEVDYVLGTMSREERERVGEAVEHAAQAVLCLLTAGVDEAMNRFN